MNCASNSKGRKEGGMWKRRGKGRVRWGGRRKERERGGGRNERRDGETGEVRKKGAHKKPREAGRERESQVIPSGNSHANSKTKNLESGTRCINYMTELFTEPAVAPCLLQAIEG